MSRFLLSLLLCLFLGTCVRAQTMPIAYEKQLIGYRFYYDNLIIQPPNFRRAMIFDQQAQARLAGAGLLELGGYLTISYGSSAALIGVFVTTERGNPITGRGYLIAGGLAGAAFGAWLVHLADKKRVRAADIYNKNLRISPTSFRPVVRPSAGSNGLGVTVSF